jgi:outer membrane protein TolC
MHRQEFTEMKQKINLFSGQLDYVKTQATVLTSLVDVCRAMGGGWGDEAETQRVEAADASATNAAPK